MSAEKSAEFIGRKLEEARLAMAQIHGERWLEMVAEWRPQIELLMAIMKTPSPVGAVIPLAKMLEEDGQNSIWILAVAAELCAQNSQAHNHQWKDGAMVTRRGETWRLEWCECGASRRKPAPLISSNDQTLATRGLKKDDE